MPLPAGYRYTHCKRGHAFTPANTYRRPDKRSRECRACRNRRSYEYHFVFRCCGPCPHPYACCKNGRCADAPDRSNP